MRSHELFTTACRCCSARRISSLWLDGTGGAGLLRPTAEDRFRTWPVSKRVNKTGSDDDDPTLIDEVAA